MRCAYNGFGEEKKIYKAPFVIDDEKVLKIYSDKRDPYLEDMISFSLQQENINKDKVGFCIYIKNNLGLFVWEGQELREFDYAKIKNPIQQVNIDIPKGGWVNDVINHEKESWKKYSKDKEKYLEDFFRE